MVTKMRFFDGAKSVTLDNLPPEAWKLVAGPGGNEDDLTTLYQTTPFFYRAVDIRANALAKLPREIMRGGGDPLDPEPEWLHNLSELLYQVETALTLYGYAYLLKDGNGLRWLSPKSIRPKYDEAEGLVGFERRLGNTVQPLAVDEVVYFWQPNIVAEVGPGPSPAKAAMASAGVLNATTQFSRNFFERGAVYPMLLTVEGNPPAEELKKLEQWWRRLLNGVKDAWKSIAVRADVKPQIIGPDPDKMAMPELTTIQRQDICTALGIPYSLVMSGAANYATANQDYLNLYDLTILPKAERIESTLNHQYLAEMGYEIKFRPERLEVYQNQNLDTGDKIVTLVSGNVLERNEGRELLGYEALTAPPPEPVVMQLPAVPPEQLQSEQLQAARQLHLEQWERKALNRMRAAKSAAVEFDSEVLTAHEQAEIMTALALCETPSQVSGYFASRGH